MKAAELRQLGNECAELARTIPGNDAAPDVRETWWKKVYALRVGPLKPEELWVGPPFDPTERSDLRDALKQIDMGKEIKNTPPTPGPCAQGLDTAGTILVRVAKRMRGGKRAAEMFADGLREAGILVCVFGVLDGFIIKEPAVGDAHNTWPNPIWWWVLGVGVVMLVAGIVLERFRDGDA